MGGVSETGNNRIMKPLIAVILFLTMTGCFTVKGQDRRVEVGGQVIVLQEGTRTTMAVDNRYIYRNDVDTAYALVVGHFYTTEEVEKAFGKPQKIKDGISYENGIAFDGSISYTYDSLFLSLNCNSGLCEFEIKRDDISFSDLGKNIKLGDNISVLTDDPDFQPLVTRQSKVYRDEKTGLLCMGIAMNYTGDDDWIYYSFWVNRDNGIDLIFSHIGYLQTD